MVIIINITPKQKQYCIGTIVALQFWSHECTKKGRLIFPFVNDNRNTHNQHQRHNHHRHQGEVVIIGEGALLRFKHEK